MDEAIVRRAHVEHRRSVLANVPWPVDALARLCDGQHELQERHIATHHPHLERWMIEVEGHTIGRLCLDRSALPWRLIDIALLPEAQGNGFGTSAVQAVLDKAQAAAASVELQVAIDNPQAEALYRGLGFVDVTSAATTHRRLVWPNGCRFGGASS